MFNLDLSAHSNINSACASIISLESIEGPVLTRCLQQWHFIWLQRVLTTCQRTLRGPCLCVPRFVLFCFPFVPPPPPPFFSVASEYFLISHFNFLCVIWRKVCMQETEKKPIHEITFFKTFRKEQPCLLYYIIKHNLLVYVGLHI